MVQGSVAEDDGSSVSGKWGTREILGSLHGHQQNSFTPALRPSGSLSQVSQFEKIQLPAPQE